MPGFDLAADLAKLKSGHQFRARRTLQSAQSTRVVVDGRELVNFCSNDYLGLANHPALTTAFKQAADTYGVGSGASHLVCGHSAEHHALEEELAAWLQRPRALLFSTGFMANLGAVKALVGRGDAVFEDRLNHASLLDAGLSSGADFQRYKHLDFSELEERLQSSSAGRKLIVTDSVFSMDGDLADMPALMRLAKQQQAWVMVDDAHGLGVLGKNGRGVLEYFDWADGEPEVVMGTLGKAMGSFGAFVAGSEDLIDYLVNHARSYIYTTAMPPAVAAATRAAIRIAQEEHWRREKLQALIGQFRTGARELGYALMDSATPIQPVILGESAQALALSRALEAKGFWVGAIRPPTVPQGTARLRVTFSAVHEERDVQALLDALASVKV